MNSVWLAAVLATLFPPPSAHSIDIQLAGILSGPARTYVDLDTGLIYFGKPSGGPPGDSAGIAIKDLTVSKTVSLSEADATRLRRLTDAALEKGLERRPLQSPTADRIIYMTITDGSRRFSGYVYWPSVSAQELMAEVSQLVAD